MSATATTTAAERRQAEVPAVRGLCAGTWVEGEGEVKETISPVDGRVVTTVRYSTPAQVDAVVAAARAAQPAWAAVPMAEKADLMHAAIDAIEARAEEIAVWVSTEVGKTIREAREEVATHITVPCCRRIVEDARRFGGETLPAASAEYPDRRVLTLHQPIGVAGFISPWNFPVEMVLNCVGALMMGNTCVWKPSEWAPYGPQLLTEALVSAGLPDGVVNLVYGGPEIGEHLVRHPDVGLVGFIGSTAVGERIASAAGVKRLLLELGGNGPLIVLDDADVDAAVRTAVTDCFYMAGQVCTAGERVLVHDAVHDEFVEKLAARVAGIRVGDPLDESTDMGPLSERRILDKVVRHVEGARAAGATVVAGGSHEGQFFAPTILTGVTTDMEVAREETFGPVAPIIRISGAEEALRIANELDYGLSMAVFTSSLKTAWQMAEGLQAGQVNVNSGTNDWELGGPFGGWKKSGVGRELGAAESLRGFANVKTVGFDLI